MNRAPLPPSPKGQFLIGNLLQLVRDPLGCIPRFVREYGDVVRLKIGTMRIYLMAIPTTSSGCSAAITAISGRTR